MKSIDLDLQTVLGLVNEAFCSREELFKRKKERDKITAENKVLLAYETENTI